MAWKKLESHLQTTNTQFWWRDDDLIEPTSLGDHMLDLSKEHSVPLAVAVIPLKASTLLGPWLKDFDVTVLQHGIRHENNSVNSKIELINSPRVIDGLKAGKIWLETNLSDLFFPVLVPPWNRIDVSLELPNYQALSTFRSHKHPSIKQLNTHIDIIDWETRGFKGEEELINEIILYSKTTPIIGLLTHHLVHDQACHKFLKKLFAITSESWLSAEDALLI